jgi:hypothetical protein
VSETPAPSRPAEFSRHLLNSLSASDGRRRKRKRDQTPDHVGLELKRDLLERAAAADPEPADFEAWLLAQTFAAPASGPVRAVCSEILDEYRFAAADPSFSRWLAAGAPSDDARPGQPKTDAEVNSRPELISLPDVQEPTLPSG